MESYRLIFDEVIVHQLKKVAKNPNVREILTKAFNRIEKLGPQAGNLIDSQLKLYEIKTKRPPIRLYYKHNLLTNEMYIFEYEMKTSEQKQQSTINKIKDKIIRFLLKS